MMEIFLNSIVATTGAFIPIFCLMCIHYRIRQSEYRKAKQHLLEVKEIYQKFVDINNQAIQQVYNSAEVASFQELIENPKGLTHLDKFQYTKLISFVNQQLDEKMKNLDKINCILLDIAYIDVYSLKNYLSTVLDKRFPDKRFS